jgi:hypothetical protein
VRLRTAAASDLEKESASVGGVVGGVCVGPCGAERGAADGDETVRVCGVTVGEDEVAEIDDRDSVMLSVPKKRASERDEMIRSPGGVEGRGIEDAAAGTSASVGGHVGE